MKKIIVLTSGGDAPGMNAAIRAVVRTGHSLGITVLGSPSGFQGLVDRTLIPLEPANVANIIQHGGTILQADRCLAFHDQKVRSQCFQFIKDNLIEGLVVIGGNGSFQGAAKLAEEGPLAIIGIPGTIDNDIPNTMYTIGFDTARNTALNAIDKIRDTASSHNRNFLVEVMGRNTGFLAVDVGIAGGADFILTPEYDPTIDALAKSISSPRRKKLSTIIVVAEASRPGRSFQIAEALERLTGSSYRVCILGHTQRGGSPTLLDRKIASEMGFRAVQGLCEGETNKMLAVNNDQIILTPFPPFDAPSRAFTDAYLLEMNKVICS